MVEVTIEYIDGNKWVPQTIKLDVDNDMSISEETLDKDMCELPKKIAYYAEVQAECQAYASRKKNDVEVTEAEVAQAFRREAAANKLKITESGIKEFVATQDVVIQARNESFAAQAQFLMMDGFYRSLREKASLAIALCYKQKEEIRVMNSPLT